MAGATGGRGHAGGHGGRCHTVRGGQVDAFVRISIIRS